jgi:hypothetical protein
MNWLLFVIVVVLFYILTPGILLSLPPGGSKYLVALTHALVFALVWALIYKPIWLWSDQLLSRHEGFSLPKMTFGKPAPKNKVVGKK